MYMQGLRFAVCVSQVDMIDNVVGSPFCSDHTQCRTDFPRHCQSYQPVRHIRQTLNLAYTSVVANITQSPVFWITYLRLQFGNPTTPVELFLFGAYWLLRLRDPFNSVQVVLTSKNSRPLRSRVI